ncbi:UrcA family protein [Sphingopyxis sp.]|uniref:UrcA family protein n=1 Tax=Sphingopyxis sp. TaxID=1908224 RepID=UPI002FCC9F60
MLTRTMILALSLTIGGLPAVAAETESASATVRVDDLDLTRATDRERLDVRLKNAARRVCHSGLRGLTEATRTSLCVSAALAHAEPQAARAIAQAQGGTRLALLMVQAAR